MVVVLVSGPRVTALRCHVRGFAPPDFSIRSDGEELDPVDDFAGIGRGLNRHVNIMTPWNQMGASLYAGGSAFFAERAAPDAVAFRLHHAPASRERNPIGPHRKDSLRQKRSFYRRRSSQAFREQTKPSPSWPRARGIQPQDVLCAE
jgi:hypothetical protein